MGFAMAFAKISQKGSKLILVMAVLHALWWVHMAYHFLELFVSIVMTKHLMKGAKTHIVYAEDVCAMLWWAKVVREELDVSFEGFGGAEGIADVGSDMVLG